MECREGERKFCMGEGTEDRRQVCGKRVVQEPGLEKEYAQPLLTLFDELLAWDPASGDSRIIFYTEAEAGCGRTVQSGNSGICLEPCTSPGVQAVPGVFQRRAHERTLREQTS
mgnify:CR=1 FL=1